MCTFNPYDEHQLLAINFVSSLSDETINYIYDNVSINTQKNLNVEYKKQALIRWKKQALVSKVNHEFKFDETFEKIKEHYATVHGDDLLKETGPTFNVTEKKQ